MLPAIPWDSAPPTESLSVKYEESTAMPSTRFGFDGNAFGAPCPAGLVLHVVLWAYTVRILGIDASTPHTARGGSWNRLEARA